MAGRMARRSRRKGILPAERHRLILEHLQARHSGKIEELANELGVSLATVRRDLGAMAAAGLVSRTHGGAVLPVSSTAYEQVYAEKRQLNLAEKQRIGVAAAALVADGDTIVLDSGSTTFQVACHLTEHKNLTIITNDLHIASSITFDPSTTLIVTGGMRRAGFSVLVGPIAEDMLRRVRVNLSFLAADAVDLEHGITNATFAETAVKQLIIAVGHRVILVTDHTKFGRAALVKVGTLADVERVVTDTGLAAETIEALRASGLTVETV